MTKTINKTIDVTAFRFRRNQKLYPQRIVLDGEIIEFVDSGISCKVNTGGRFSEVLSLTDGFKQYSLRSDGRGGLWTLLSMSA